ncbi:MULTISPECIES: GNAT family N-acetyltransferase [unclassified Nocardia]|uniref:GNAT family N-acetyltransferase n=1 Tax=unclassified Nocardia TaxID=2637762 RepID=UPI0033A40D92
MLIRPGGVADATAVAALHAASWRVAYAGILPAAYLAGPMPADLAARWRSILVDARTPGFLVAEGDGELLGFVYLRPMPDGRVLLDNLHARPGRLGRGIGTGLIESGLAWSLREYPDRPVYLEVLRENSAAIAFYEHRGWRRTDARIGHFDAGFAVPEYEYTWTAGVAFVQDRGAARS